MTNEYHFDSNLDVVNLAGSIEFEHHRMTENGWVSVSDIPMQLLLDGSPIHDTIGDVYDLLLPEVRKFHKQLFI